MRLLRNVIILSVVLIIVVGAFVFINFYGDKKPDNTEATATTDESLSILTLNKDDMVEVTIENKDVKYVLSHTDKDFKLTYPVGMKYDSVLVNGTFESLSALNAVKSLGDNVTDLAKYGLDKPATVTVKLKNGTSKTLEIGNETPSKETVYVKLKGSNKVYTASSDTISTLKVNKVYYKDRKLYAPKKEDINELTLERSGQKIFTVNRASADKWVISQPVSGNIDANKMETLLTYFTTLSAANFEENVSPDISVYELDKPSYTVEVKSKTGNIKLILGKELPDTDQIYGKLADSGEVFTLTLSSMKFLDMSLSDLLERFICIPDIADVSDISVNMDGQTTNSVINLDPGENKDKDKFTVNGKDASGKDANGDFYFRNYYKALIGIGFTDLDINAKPTGTPEVTIVYHLKKAPGTAKVELIPKNADSYYAMVDGKYTGKIVFKRDFDQPEGIRETYKKLMDNINKK